MASEASRTAFRRNWKNHASKTIRRKSHASDLHPHLGSPAASLPQDAGLQPWASKAQPGDVAKRHVEEISQTEHTYTVVHGGTVDGECCRTPMGCGINREGVIDQSWQSNRAVRMENVGQTDLVNPWLSNGRNNFRTLDEIVASAITPGMSDKEKAMALWFQHVSRRFHRGGYGGNLGDPVLVFNMLRTQRLRDRTPRSGPLLAEGGIEERPGPAGDRTPSPKCSTTAAGT